MGDGGINAWGNPIMNSGLEVNFSVHLQSLASKIFSTSKFFPTVWETWMILTRKRLLVDVLLRR